MASNLSSGSGASVIFLLTGSPDRVSTLSRPGTCVPYPAGYPGRPAGGASHRVRVPAAFRPPAFASRSSDSRRGVRPSSRSAYRTRGPDPDGLPRSTRTSCDRGGCLLYPEDGDAHPTGPSSPASACRFSTASPCTPLHHPSSEASDNEASTEVHAIHPSGHSPRLWPPDGTGALGLLPRASNPADQEPATHVRVGTGLEHKPGTTLTTSAEPPIRASTRKRATSRRTGGF